MREMNKTLAMVGPGLCLALVPALGCDESLIMLLIVLAMFFYGSICGGDMAIVSDFAPEVVGSVFGLCNMFSSVAGIIGPIAFGLVVNDNVSGLYTMSSIA